MAGTTGDHPPAGDASKLLWRQPQQAAEHLQGGEYVGGKQLPVSFLCGCVSLSRRLSTWRRGEGR